MKKSLFCVMLSICLCFSFSTLISADARITESEGESNSTAPMLETRVSMEEAVAVGKNLITGNVSFYRVNGAVLTDGMEDCSTEGMVPAELALHSQKNEKLRTVIGDDGRTPVEDTSVFPYSSVVLIKVVHYNSVTAEEEITWGTGCMISSDTVFTAAHVLIDDIWVWPTRIEVYPGVNSNSLTNTPFGSTYAVEVVSCIQYYSYESEYHDWGLIKLADDIGNNCGYLGIKFMTRNMANLNVLSIGYPGDLNGFEDAISGNEQYKQWEQTQPVVQDVTEDATPATYRRFIYQLDTYHGQSGAPILYNNKCIGVHYGALASAHNVGFGITSQLYSFLIAYR